VKRRASSPTLDVPRHFLEYSSMIVNIISEYDDKKKDIFALILPFLLKYGNFSCEKHFMLHWWEILLCARGREFFLNRKWVLEWMKFPSFLSVILCINKTVVENEMNEKKVSMVSLHCLYLRKHLVKAFWARMKWVYPFKFLEQGMVTFSQTFYDLFRKVLWNFTSKSWAFYNTQ
jgi:hypothetical protein